jgi:apolipoprotein N-acyltransferase
LTGTVQGREGTTPYAWWAARAGLWPLGLAAAAAVLCLVWRRRRQGGLPAA